MYVPKLDLNIDETSRVRDDAEALIAHLVAQRDESARRLASVGRRDPMRVVTGRSAIESAIADMQRMIEHMDELIHEFESELGLNGYSRTEVVGAEIQSVR